MDVDRPARIKAATRGNGRAAWSDAGLDAPGAPFGGWRFGRAWGAFAVMPVWMRLRRLSSHGCLSGCLVDSIGCGSEHSPHSQSSVVPCSVRGREHSRAAAWRAFACGRFLQLCSLWPTMPHPRQ